MSEAREIPARVYLAIAALTLDLADLLEIIGLQWELDRQERLEP